MMNSDIQNTEVYSSENSTEINPRQQDKIIAFVTGKTDKVDNRFEYVNENEREMFLLDLKEGKYSDNDFDRMLKGIEAPIKEKKEFDESNSVNVYEKISSDKRQMGIVAIFAMENLSQVEHVQPRDLYDFFRMYPTPFAFEKASKAYLEHVEETCGKTYRDIWEKSMESFNENIYGKRYEYYKQMKFLKEDASSKDLLGEEGFTPKIREISELESDAILGETKIEGDSLNGRFLTTDILKQEGLEPKYSFEVDGSTIIFSKNAFEFNDGNRLGIIGYVIKDGKVFARTYYLSGSQGCWRYLPGYIKNIKNGKESVDWYGKGYQEDSINLPAVTQKALATLMQKEYSVPKHTKNNPNFIFAGTARAFSSMLDTPSPERNIDKAYYREMSRSSVEFNADWYTSYDSSEKVPPEELVLSESESPDFSKVLLKWSMPTKVYGEVVSRVFKSKDGRFAYTFSTTSDGKSWITSIEDNTVSVDGTTGLKSSYVSSRDLTSPCAEYWKQGGNYVVYNKDYGKYGSMYENYISKIPVIKEYTKKFVEKNE